VRFWLSFSARSSDSCGGGIQRAHRRSHGAQPLEHHFQVRIGKFTSATWCIAKRDLYCERRERAAPSTAGPLPAASPADHGGLFAWSPQKQLDLGLTKLASPDV